MNKEKDLTEKTLEAYSDVFADIVNGLLFHGDQVISEDQLIDAQPFSMIKADGQIHEQDRDVAKFWVDPEGRKINVRIALLGMENQTSYDKDMPLRVISYDGAAYRAQLDVNERYPVVTLVLYFGDDRWGENRSLYDVIDIPEILQPFVSNYRINVFEIAHLEEKDIRYFKSDFQVVVDYFVHKRTDPSYRPKDPVRFRHVDELLKLMSVLTRDPRFVDTLQKEGGRPENMDKLLDMIEARGEERGIQKGRLATLADLVKDNTLSLKAAAEKANMTVAEFEREAGLVADQAK